MPATATQEKERVTLFEASPKQQEFIEAVFNPQYSFVLYGGAIRGGKTFAVLGLFCLLCRLFPKSRWAIIRENHTQMSLHVLSKIDEVFPPNFIASMPSAHNKWTLTTTNGSQVIFVSENYDQNNKYLEFFKGLEIDGFAIEEMSGIRKATFDKLMERLGTWRMKDRLEAKRQGKPTPPNVGVATCNPTHNWVKDEFYTPYKRGKLPKHYCYIPARVYDNPFVSEEWVKMKRQQMTATKFQIFVDGDWEINLNEKPWCYEFEREIHVTDYPLQIDPHYPLILSFDFNVDPVSCVPMQHILGKGVFVYPVIQKDGGTEAILPYLYKFKQYLIKIVGDRSGHSRSSSATRRNGELDTSYKILKRFFRVKIDKKTQHQNARHIYSRELINQAFYSYPIFIDGSFDGNIQRNEKLINELGAAQPTKTGGLLKDDNLHRNDALDAFRYGMHWIFPKGADSINKFLRLIPADIRQRILEQHKQQIITEESQTTINVSQSNLQAGGGINPHFLKPQ